MEETVCAEGFGPAGCALIVTGRAPHADLREAARQVLARHGGRAGAQNSVAYLFHPVGVLRYPAGGPLAERALAAGAESVRPLGGGEIEVLTDPADLQAVAQALARSGHAARGEGRVLWRAAQPVPLAPEEGRQLADLLAELTALEGVAQVYTNGALP